MNYDRPKVTVLMPVYNCEKYLSAAIESILQQTFTDFELLIINDGSNDHSVQIIEKHNDPRIRLIHSQKNIGLPSTLNKGLDLAQGQYIARMDCDDISHTERLKKQVEFMDNHPEIGVCGTWVELIGEQSGVWQYPTDHKEIKASLIFESPFAHPSIIIRTSKLMKHNLYYDPAYLHAEDFELWHRCGDHFILANLPEVLLKYRMTSSSISRSNREKQLETLRQIYEKSLTTLNINPKEGDYEIHHAISAYSFVTNDFFVKKAKQWLERLHVANFKQDKFPEPFFSEILANRWFWICYNAKNLGLWVWQACWGSPLSRYNKVSLKHKLIFALSIVIFRWKISSSMVTKFFQFFRVIRFRKLRP